MIIWGENPVKNGFVIFWQSFLISRIKMLETSLKNEKLFLHQRSQIVDLTEISVIWGSVLTSFWVKDNKKWYNFCFWSRHFFLGSAPATPLKSETIWRSCCLKTTIVVFVANNCWFYQNLNKICTTNENWIVGRWGGTNLLSICCHRVPHQ